MAHMSRLFAAVTSAPRGWAARRLLFAASREFRAARELLARRSEPRGSVSSVRSYHARSRLVASLGLAVASALSGSAARPLCAEAPDAGFSYPTGPTGATMATYLRHTTPETLGVYGRALRNRSPHAKALDAACSTRATLP